MSNETVLRMANIDKRFGGVHALDNVTFEVRKGEVHVLMGENGAGKSTLMKILDGLYSADTGEIYLDGEKVVIDSPTKAKELGVAMIHQELSMCTNMTIAENIYRGEEPAGALGFVNYKKLYADAQKVLDDMEMSLDAHTPVGELSIAQQQMVEIAGAVSHNAKVVIMDEPTSSLTEKEIQELYKIVSDLKAKGVGIIYISHRMNETFDIGDRITVLRDGTYVATCDVKGLTEDDIIEMMVGRSIGEVYAGERAEGGEVVLDVQNFTNAKLKHCSFQLRKGEILGFAGLMGAGRTETMRLICGADPKKSGRILVNGKEVKIRSPRDAVGAGIGYLSEDRKRYGLCLGLSVSDNTVLSSLERFTTLGIVNDRKIEQASMSYVDKVHTKTPTVRTLVRSLSGGNQQKVVLSKWLLNDCDVLIFDEPTRGIDVGAKSEIYKLMNQLVEEGKSIIMISSELPELLRMSDRVVVMCEGRKTGELDIAEATQEKIMTLATKREVG